MGYFMAILKGQFQLFLESLSIPKITFFRGCKRQNNGSVLLTTTLPLRRNCFHSSLAGDGQDGSGLQLEKIGHFFQVPPVYAGKMA